VSKKNKSKPLELGSLDEALRRTRLMALVMVASIAGVTAAVAAMAAAPKSLSFPLADSSLRYAFALAGAVLIPFGMFFRAHLLNLHVVARRAWAIHQGAGGGAEGELRARSVVSRVFFLGHMIPLFLCEGTSLLGLFALLASGDQVVSLGLAVSGLATALLHFPRRTVLSDLVRYIEAAS
jgi:hypothetical protein